MSTIALNQIKPNQTFYYCPDGKIYTFKSYTLRDMFYNINAWSDHSYDYDEYGCIVDIYVKERKEPISIKFEDSSRWGRETGQITEDYIKQEVQNLIIGYEDAGPNTRYLNQDFETYVVIWFNKNRNRLNQQMFDAWDDVDRFCSKLTAKHIPYQWYKGF